MNSVVKCLKYKYLKYVFKIHCMYFEFCILVADKMYFVFQIHNFVYFVFEIQFGPNRIHLLCEGTLKLLRELTVLCVNLSSEF